MSASYGTHSLTDRVDRIGLAAYNVGLSRHILMTGAKTARPISRGRPDKLTGVRYRRVRGDLIADIN
jgi:hypothetical protein